MEYRRRRRRRRGAKQGATNAGNTAKVVVVLLVLAAVIYVISASAVGTWIAENVFAPIFTTIDGWFSGEGGAATPPPSNTGLTLEPPAIIGGAGAAPAAASVTDEVAFPALECYALQMGVYNDKVNADSQAGELKARGAGGYVMEDAGRYRVLAAAYSTQDSLRAVRDQLQAEGLESAAYVFSAQQSTLRITATQAQLDGIAAGFSALTGLTESLAAASLQYDTQQLTPASGRESAGTMLSRLRQDMDAFSVFASSDNPILSATMECFRTCEDALAALAGDPTESTVDFSSKMKYTHISVIHAYDKLAKQISGNIA